MIESKEINAILSALTSDIHRVDCPSEKVLLTRLDTRCCLEQHYIRREYLVEFKELHPSFKPK